MRIKQGHAELPRAYGRVEKLAHADENDAERDERY